ncbi:trypsin-like peptidase domain-containing protein [Nonomuraea sp. NPDC046570]|uniref:S1C family serine protease n=1 Tax=Nonomuraea sp. NPDC046570 TaxID=3155255 RepID=UPI0033F2A00D
MTDETRPDEGRTPSDLPEPQRPDFLPADEQRTTGDPQDRAQTEQLVWSSAAEPQPGSRPTFESPSGWGDPSGRSGDTAIFSSPDGGPRGGYGSGAPSPGGYGSGAPGSGGYSSGAPGSGGSGQVYGDASFGDSGFFSGPGNGSGHGGSGAGFGGPPPPPPGQALGLGAGWAPPPPPSGGGGAGGARRTPGTGVLVVLAIVIALVASTLGSVGTYLLTGSRSGTDPSFSLGPAPAGNTVRAPDSVAGVASRVLPSVVSLEVESGADGGTGSGFLIKGGYVVTNNHVVAMAAQGGEIQIVFNNRKSTTGRIVGTDPGSDLAVVKPEETFGTPEITLGNSDEVVVGDPVIAIGSPLGLSGTVTTGIVSSLNRPVRAGEANDPDPAFISAIQTDAAINPGNSGGPLVNARGEVVGVNSAIATLSRAVNGQSGSIGLGFAIPVNQARRVAEEIVTTGKARRSRIGVVLDQSFRGEGIRIASQPSEGRQPVEPNGPAGKAGLKAGDVIVEMDGLKLQDGDELIALIRSKAPGSKINLTYKRGSQEKTVTVTVEAETEPTPTPTRS